MKWILIIALILVATISVAKMDITIELGIEPYASGGGASPGDALFLETGDYLLLETGDKLLLE